MGNGLFAADFVCVAAAGEGFAAVVGEGFAAAAAGEGFAVAAESWAGRVQK